MKLQIINGMTLPWVYE